MEQLFRKNGKHVYFVFKESFDRKYYVWLYEAHEYLDSLWVVHDTSM